MKIIRTRNALLSAIIILASICLGMPISATADRDELGRVLSIMPPNGPPEQYGTVIMRKRSIKAGMAPVVFPHWLHRARYTCSVCHGELELLMRRGANGIGRNDCLAGKQCGACHDGKTAFTVRDTNGKKACDSCHLKSLTNLNSKFRQFAAELPKTGYGNQIDWQAALSQGLISPKNSLSDSKPLPKLPAALKKPLDLSTTSPRSSVSFSHEEHLAELDCSNCHPDIFDIKKRGTQLFSMESNLYGQFCGACHMKVAFPMDDCRRCHAGMSSSSF